MAFSRASSKKQLFELVRPCRDCDAPRVTQALSTICRAPFLAEIDQMRHSYGAPSSEPRHSDPASGKAWRIIGSSSEACDVEHLATLN